MYQFQSASGLVGVNTYESADSIIWEVFTIKSADIHEFSQLIHYYLYFYLHTAVLFSMYVVLHLMSQVTDS
jgi:hypothetical protein